MAPKRKSARNGKPLSCGGGNGPEISAGKRSIGSMPWLIPCAGATVLAVGIGLWKLKGESLQESATVSDKLLPLARYGLDANGLPFLMAGKEACPIDGRDGSVFDCLFHDLYTEVDPSGGSRFDMSLGSEGTYGEITFAGVHSLLYSLRVSTHDVFYDLGSGTGKVVLQAFLSTTCSRAVGVELSQNRHSLAERAGNRLVQHLGGSEALTDRLAFFQGDATKTDITDGSIIFMCSLCFPDFVLASLTRLFFDTAAPGTVVTSLNPLEPCHPGLTLIGYLPLQMTWKERFEMLIYVVSPPSTIAKQLISFAGRGAAPLSTASATTIAAPQLVAMVDASQANATTLTETLTMAVLEKLAPGALRPELFARLLSLLAARKSGKKGGSTSLGYDGSTKLRSRELVDEHMRKTATSLLAADLVHFVLSRLRGDEDTILDCLVSDLYQKVLPKLKPEELTTAYTSAQPQVQMPADHLAAMLHLFKPQLDQQDVFVEAHSGTGHLTALVRLLTDAGTVVGCESTGTRHTVAASMKQRLAACALLGENKSCPGIFQVLAAARGKTVQLDLDAGMEQHFTAGKDPIVKAVSWPGATATVTFAQGWPTLARMDFAWMAAARFPTGGVILMPAVLHGCRRGMLEGESMDLSELPRGSRAVFSSAPTIAAFLVTIQADPHHPFFSTAEDVAPKLRDMLAGKLGKAMHDVQTDKKAQHIVVSFAEAERILVHLGPPFMPMKQPARFDRIWQMMPLKPTRNEPRVPEGHVGLAALVRFLKAGIQGNSYTPFECVCSDFDIVANEAFHQAQPRPVMPSIEWRPLAVAELLRHERIAPRLAHSTLLVLGDCRLAAMALFLPNGPRQALCMEKSNGTSSLFSGYETALKWLRKAHPPFLAERHLQKSDLEASSLHNVSMVLVSSSFDLKTPTWPRTALVVSLLGGTPPAIGLGLPLVDSWELARAWIDGRTLVNIEVQVYEG